MNETPSASAVSELTRLAGFLKPYRGTLVLALVSLLVSATAALILPVALRHMIDLGFLRSDIDHIERYITLLFVVAVAYGLFAALRFYFMAWLGERVVADIRRDVFEHLLGLSPSFLESTRTGAALSRLTTDTTLIQMILSLSVANALRNTIMLIGTLVMLGATSLHLTGVTALLLLVVVAPIIFFGRHVRRLARLTQDRVADASALADEKLTAITTVQAFAREHEEGRRFADAVELGFRTALRRIRVRAVMTAVVIVVVFAAIVLVLRLGAYEVVDGTMTTGQLGQFLLYAVMTAGAIGGLSEDWSELQRAAGATGRVMELLATQPEVASPASPIALPSVRGEIRFADVEFRYPSRPERPALYNFNLTVAAGETVALVGPSGAGKSTVLHLLLRFHDPQRGRIDLDAVDITQVTLQALRRQIAIVPQETVIFSDNIFENIRYGRIDASDDEVRAAARAAMVEEFVERLPDGYGAFLGERGVRLSGGQRQRIAIARAILKDAPILLLDEATSALDAESERQVQIALEHLMQGRTTLVIAHRLATVRKADRIVVMDDGRIVAAGSHDSLEREGGLYARLAALQFGLRIDPTG